MVKYILEYRYANNESEWLHDDEYSTASQAHFALVEHVEDYKHIECRVRRVESAERIVGHFMPISSEEYDDE